MNPPAGTPAYFWIEAAPADSLVQPTTPSIKKGDYDESRQLIGKPEIRKQRSHAEPLHVDRDGRAILFTLKPGQSIREHNAPSSAFFVVILKGEGTFAGGDGIEHTCEPNTLLIFDAAERHAIRAAANELVFVGFLHGVPLAQKKSVSLRLGCRRPRTIKLASAL